MKRISYKSALIWLATLLTLGSGIVNFFSVMSPALPERSAILRDIFPIVFLHFSRLASLVIGFSLIISSLNIFKRKRRAFYSVILLSVFSVLFHLTKGLDYEEATLSLVLIGLLWSERKQFTVKSRTIDLKDTLLRLGFSATVAILYGVIGFWFLDPKEFGIDFSLGDAFQSTLLLYSLVGDPGLQPLTRHAHWFIDSLYTITGAFIFYTVFTVFRPMVYRFRTHPLELAAAKALVEKYGRSSLDYFKYWPDKSFFFSPSQECFLSYRVGGRYALVLGDPVGSEEEIEDTIRRFVDFCRDNDWSPAFHQTLPDFLEIYQSHGFRKLKIGDEAVVDLTEEHLDGLVKRFEKVNRRLERLGLHTEYYDSPVPDDILFKLKGVSDEWLQIQGHRERGFTLGLFDPDYVRNTPVFVVADGRNIFQAFVNIIPSFHRGGATIDLMRRRENAPGGVMDYLFVKMFLLSREKGFTAFDLGMAPMAGFQEREEATAEERAIHFFFQRLNFLFSYRGLRSYKAKFASRWEPRYLVFRNTLDLPGLAAALNTVSTIREDDRE